MERRSYGGRVLGESFMSLIHLEMEPFIYMSNNNRFEIIILFSTRKDISKYSSRYYQLPPFHFSLDNPTPYKSLSLSRDPKSIPGAAINRTRLKIDLPPSVDRGTSTSSTSATKVSVQWGGGGSGGAPFEHPSKHPARGHSRAIAR